MDKKLTQTEFGRAFEWAVGSSIKKHTAAQIIENPFSKNAENSYRKMSEKTKDFFTRAADISVLHILEKEKKH